MAHGLMPAGATLQIEVGVLLARAADELLDAFLASDAGLLVAAERRAEEALGHVVIQTKPASTAAAARYAVTRSLVQIEQVSQYSTSLTCASVSPSWFHLRMERIGSKISSLPIRMSMVTSANTVGSR